MKTEFYKLAMVDGVPQMVRSENGGYVRREDHDRQVEGLVNELAEKERQTKETFIPASQIADFAADRPRVQFEIGGSEVPEKAKHLLWQFNDPSHPNDDRVCGDHNRAVLEAFSLGRQSRQEQTRP